MRGQGLELKEPSGWFAAGEAFGRALRVLSDGAFKLFAYLCLEADRQTGRFQSTQGELAQALGKSRRALGTYLQELEAKGICEVRNGKNQYARTTVQIGESYWPYRQPQVKTPLLESPESQTYVESVRRLFLDLGCSAGRFTTSDVRQAQRLKERGIPLTVVQDAMLLGACRKYLACLQGHSPQLIGSFGYFEPLIEEIQRQPFPPGYRDYLEAQLRKLSGLWKKSAPSSRQRGKATKPGSAKK
ncbi:helix-turn-helix domain-containing protein [Acidobacteria bacterium AH-259-O06]|nr:helix-turn-helix domain-containing protein [Acidobacteria bacterium AH-259-O06]